jgi:hypothetical protein
MPTGLQRGNLVAKRQILRKVLITVLFAAYGADNYVLKTEKPSDTDVHLTATRLIG